MRRDLTDQMRPWIHDHMTRAVRTDDWEAYNGLQQGQTYADIPPHLQRYRTDIFTDKYKRLSWDELSRTITAHIAKDGYWYIHPEQHRTLSIREAARVQTFPDWFRFAGQPSHRLAQIGNAVPPLAAEYVGAALIRSIQTPAPPPQGRADARDSLLEWNAREPVHPWRRPGVAPWMVLAAELGLERSSSVDVAERFASLRAVAPGPAEMLKLDNPESALRAAGLSTHAARLLTRAAEAVIELFGGEVPTEDLELRAIPGVGDSVAKTVLCFGHGRSAVPLHSAVSRVATRVAGSEHRRRWQLRLDLHQLAGPSGPDGPFNAAVLQLGTTICRPVVPRCSECPLRPHCATARRGGVPATVEEPAAA